MPNSERKLSPEYWHLDELVDEPAILRLAELAEAAGVDLQTFIWRLVDEKIQRELGR